MLRGSQRLALSRAEHLARQAVRETLRAYASTAWARMGSWRDADVDRFVGLMVPKVRAGQTNVARLTNTYLARAMETPPGGLVDVTSLRAGVTAQQVYRRPALTLYDQLSSGATFSTAFTIATQRLVNLVMTDLQLAMQWQARKTLTTATGAAAYRRTLTGHSNCGLCMIASTQRYWKGDLLPIHPGCQCGVEPLAAGEANHQVIDPELLEQTHNWVQSLTDRDSDRGARDLGLGKVVEYTAPGSEGTRLADYTELILTREHGELGPTLTWRHQNFTSAADLS